MRRFPITLSGSILLSLVTFGPSPVLSQLSELGPVTVGSPMPDLTLPVFQGGELRLSDLRGKNVMIVFPRGLSRPDSWCHVCPYQHAELVEYERESDFRARENLEILYVFPYSRDKVAEWIEAYPQLLQEIEDWKNPPDPGSLDEAGLRRMERSKRAYPKTFPGDQGLVPTLFPILVDADHSASDGLGFFTTSWGGSNAQQNVPTVLIIDPQGVLQFKYLSQNTLDRPPLEYLIRVVDIMNQEAG